MKVLLDTNAYSALRRGHPFVVEQVRQSESVLLSAVVAGELIFGFRNGSRYHENHSEFLEFLGDAQVHLLPITLETADHFGRISALLKSRGTPIPTNDIWIAAHTVETGAQLISSDRHFARIDEISWLSFG